MLNKQKITIIGDLILSVICLGQPLFLLLQLLLGNSGLLSLEDATLLRVILSALPVVLGLPFLLYRGCLRGIIYYSIAIALFICSFFIQPSNMEFLQTEGVKFLLLINIPILLSLHAISNSQVFYRTLSFVALLCAIIGLVYFVLLINGFIILDDIYNMSFGYGLLLPILYGFMRRKSWTVLISILLTLILLFTGSRGPLVAIFVFVVFNYGLLGSLKSKLLLLLFCVLFIIAVPTLFMVYQSQGFESRTLTLLFGGNYISHTSGRSEIYSYIFNLLKDSPFIGYGIFGDRLYLNGVYTHNLFLEVLFDFGIFIGSTLIILLFSYIIYIYGSLAKPNRKLLLFFICFSLIELFVSSSYLVSSSFFLLLGVIFRSDFYLQSDSNLKFLI